MFRRREAEGVLPSGEAAALYSELNADIAAADIVIQPETADMEREFGAVLEKCFSQTPPTFIRTNDALHLASAKVAGERIYYGGCAAARGCATDGIHGVALVRFSCPSQSWTRLGPFTALNPWTELQLNRRPLYRMPRLRGVFLTECCPRFQSIQKSA